MESTFIELIVFFINKISYFGLYILMCLESTALPLPSELILPFSGWVLVKDSSIVQITILTIIASLGSVSGSLIEYYIAKTLGRAFFIKYGKYILFDENDLNKTESFFNLVECVTTKGNDIKLSETFGNKIPNDGDLRILT